MPCKKMGSRRKLVTKYICEQKEKSKEAQYIVDLTISFLLFFYRLLYVKLGFLEACYFKMKCFNGALDY